MSKQLEQTLNGGTIFGEFAATMKRWWVAPSILLLVALLSYAPSLAIPPLLDEQFLLAWIKKAGTQHAPFGQYLMWRGFAPADMLGPLSTLSLKILHTLAFGAPFMMRLQGLLIHTGAAWIFFLLLVDMLGGFWLPIVCSILFVLFPLNVEAVTWLGGRGSLLAGLFFIASAYLYRRSNKQWRGLACAVVLFVCALLFSASIWPLALVFACYELFNWAWRKGDVAGSGSTLSIVVPLTFLVVVAAYVAATGLWWQMSTVAAPDFHVPTIVKTLRACLFPINESIWPQYVKQYRVLYVLFAPLGVAFLVACIKDGRFRQIAVGALLGMLLSVALLMGHVDARGTGFGSHLMYSSSFFISCFVALLMFAPYAAIPRWPYVGGFVSVAVSIFLSFFYLSHVWKQNSAYSAGGRLLAKVQKSIAVVSAKTQMPYVFVRDVPTSVAIAPGYSTQKMVAFNAPTGLLAAPAISAGRLDDQLREGKYLETALRWQRDLNSLIALDLGEVQPTTTAADLPVTTLALDGTGVADRFMPPIQYYQVARFDAAANEVVLESNSGNGAAIKLKPDGLTPLSGDFLYLDAKIQGPNMGVRPLIELYWFTGESPDYDNRERCVWTVASIGDNQYHRYYLPLRTTGWVTGGSATGLTLGFPAGAKVSLRGMGVESASKVTPMLQAIQPAEPAVHRPYDPPYYDFPRIAELGYYKLEPGAQSLDLSYTCQDAPGAAGVQVEISMPDKVFNNPNGDELSNVTLKAFTVNGTHGTYSVPMSDFAGTGVYSLRAMTIDQHHNPIGNFGDCIYVYVNKPQRNGHSTE